MNINDIPKEILVKLYTTILKIRLVQLRIEELYPKDEMKTPVHLCIGQEAVAAGVCANLTRDDYVFSNHRGHGHYIAKGGDLKAMIAELYCKETGCSHGRGGSMHLVDTSVSLLGSSSIVGGGISIAVGAALSSAIQGKSEISLVFFGDGASEEGVFYESMNFAKLKNLPVVFVCENNFYSVYSHIENREANEDIFLRARAFDIPSYKVDGFNVIDVYLTSKKAIDDARAGKGPSLIECKVYRFRDHAGVGDSLKLKYRKLDELEKWTNRDPLRDFEKVLLEEKIITDEKINELNKKLSSEIEDAFKYARESPLPDKKDVMKYLFAE